jgi:hypothetical protein
MSLTSSLALSSLTAPSKRKATSFDDDIDAENVDPVIFLSPKRSKCPDGSSRDSVVKPVNFFLSKAPPSPNDDFSCLKPTVTAPRRPILPARSPLPRLSTAAPITSSTLSAPAGRSPTRKRVGILNRRRTASPFTRVDPPKFGGARGLGFSIDAALSGTIPSYAARHRPAPEPKDRPAARESKDSWFFDIHEDTADELATNLMEHSTCTLDISSDEESEARLRDHRGKENVPPLDDISQTRTQLSEPAAAESAKADLKARARVSSRRRREIDDGAIDVDRCPLGEMPAEDFYAEGCDGESVFLVPADAAEDEDAAEPEPEPAPATFGFGVAASEDVDELMRKCDGDAAPKAALLEPLEKAEEGFEVWESGSAKGDE